MPGTSPVAVSVSASSNWASPKSSRRHGDRVASSSRMFAGLTSRWTMPLRVRVRRGLEHLCSRLDRAGVVELAGADRLAQRLSGDVLVGDVDVPLVAVDRDRRGRNARSRSLATAWASRSARAPALPSRGTTLSATSRSLDLVAREPDGAGAAAAERAHGPVAAEDESRGGVGERSGPSIARATLAAAAELLHGTTGRVRQGLLLCSANFWAMKASTLPLPPNTVAACGRSG